MNETILPFAETFGFTLNDLKANRKHKLSGVQTRRLGRDFLLTFIGWLLLIFIPIFITWGLVSWSGEISWGEAINDSRALIGYIIGILLGLLYAAGNFRSLLLIIDLFTGRVGSLKGKPQVWGRYLVFGKYRFVMDESALEEIQKGLTYRVFILPLSQTLLSIEYAE